MANYKTGAQRYNDRMDKIFAHSKELNEKYHGKDSFGTQKSKSKALSKGSIDKHEVKGIRKALTNAMKD
jgi:hypothetical protein